MIANSLKVFNIDAY